MRCLVRDGCQAATGFSISGHLEITTLVSYIRLANCGRNRFSQRSCAAPSSTFAHSHRKFGCCSYRGANLDCVASGNSSNERRTASAGGRRTNMKTTSESNPAAAQPRPEMKIGNNAMTRGPHRKTEPSAFRRNNARAPQNAQRNYEHYLALARAESLTGDRITAENYFQHAEHYFRSMGENPN